MEICFFNFSGQKFDNHSNRSFYFAIDSTIKIIEKYTTKMKLNQQSDYSVIV